MEHWIAKHIMKQLLTKNSATWSELRPEGESYNLFGYYMKRLVVAGLVKNKDKSWHLTKKGRVTLSDVSLDTMRETKTPKLCVLFAAKCGDRVAVYKWKRSPYSGKVTLPYGRWHRGDTFAEAAQSELIEKAGVELAPEMFHFSYLQSVDESTIHEVHAASELQLTSCEPYDSQKGRWFWASTTELATLEWATAAHRTLAETFHNQQLRKDIV